MRRILLLTLLVLPLSLARAEGPKTPPEGFKSLFNGKDLEGWKATGKKEVWGADKDAGVIFVAGGGGGYLMTEKEYGDFEMRFEYKMPKNANSGVALRAPLTGDPAYVGMEIQLIDDENWEKVRKSKLADYQHTGSIYDVQPAKEAKNKKIGDWNTVRIVCRGRKVTIEQNGQELVNANLDDYKAKFDKHPGLKRENGKIGFQSYNIRVEFKNVSIKELK
jgi:hypothetical protein